MFELIVTIILLISLGGVAFILYKKLPVLVAMPQNGSTGFKKHQIILDAENKFKNILIYFEKQIYLHRFLSFIKIITLKIEIRIDHLLHNIRKKAQEIDKNVKK